MVIIGMFHYHHNYLYNAAGMNYFVDSHVKLLAMYIGASQVYKK